MILVKLQGGLGNQMFQYAAGKALAKLRHTALFLDHHFLEDHTERPNHVIRHYDLDVFQLQARRARRSQLRFFFEKWPVWKSRAVQLGLMSPHTLVREAGFRFDKTIFGIKGHLYLDGYWQSPLYFSAIEEEIRKDFRFCDPLMPVSRDLGNRLMMGNSVCVNVRRGDFLKNDFHPVCTPHYYFESMSFITSKLPAAHFYFFSDDKEWCSQQFGQLPNTTVVGVEHDGDQYANKMQLMSLCRHFIIANSSFAWWAVWLANKNNNIVIAPSTWFSDPAWDTSDLLPTHWTRLPNK